MNQLQPNFFQNYHTDEKKSNDENSSSFPRWFVFLFMLFCIYLVVPIGDVPLLGLSLSAPIFFMLAIHTLLKPPEAWFKKFENWLFLAALIWAGIASSFFVNELINNHVDFNFSGLSILVHYAFWMVVFVVTVYICSHEKMLTRTIKWLGWGVLAVAILRWVEALVFERIGYWSGTQFFTQNMYGFLFSAFSPFAYTGLLEKGSKFRVIRIISIILIWGAAAINGSRGSWISMLLGAMVMLIFLLFSNPRKFAAITIAIFFIFITTGMFLFSNQAYSQTFTERYETLLTLEEDKTYMVRNFLNQKSLFIFEESPVFGIGPSRYSDIAVSIPLPELIRGNSLETLNRKSPHNAYLGVLAENGLVGAIPLGLLLIILSINGGLSVFNQIKQNHYWALYPFIAFVQMSAHFWVLAGLTGTSTWFIYGLVGAVIVINKKGHSVE